MAKATRITEPTPTSDAGPPKLVEDLIGPADAAELAETQFPQSINAAMVAGQVGNAAMSAILVLKARGIPADVAAIQRVDILAQANARRRALGRIQIRQTYAEAADLERQARTPRPSVRGQGARSELQADVARAQLTAANCGSNPEQLRTAYEFTRLCLDDIGQTILHNWATDVGMGHVIEPMWRVDHPVPASQLDRARSLRSSAVELLHGLDNHPAFGVLS